MHRLDWHAGAWITKIVFHHDPDLYSWIGSVPKPSSCLTNDFRFKLEPSCRPIFRATSPDVCYFTGPENDRKKSDPFLNSQPTSMQRRMLVSVISMLST